MYEKQGWNVRFCMDRVPKGRFAIENGRLFKQRLIPESRNGCRMCQIPAEITRSKKPPAIPAAFCFELMNRILDLPASWRHLAVLSLGLAV